MFGAIGSQLLPQPLNGGVNGSVRHWIIGAPHIFNQVTSAQHLCGFFHQHVEQVEFFPGQPAFLNAIHFHHNLVHEDTNIGPF